MRISTRQRLASLTAVVVVTGSTGCFKQWCGDYVTCDGTGGASGSSSTTSGASVTSSSSGIAQGCVPTATNGPKDTSCGIFIDPMGGLDTNPGTLSSPKKTLSNALGVWTAGKGIYSCDGALSDTEGVLLPAGVVLYGGLDCANEFRLGAEDARTMLSPKAGDIPVTLSDGAGTTEVHRFAFNAVAASSPSSSAIAVVVGNVVATLDAVDAIAGDGADGFVGTTPTDNVGSSNPDDASVKGLGGNPADVTMVGTANPGGVTVTNPLCTTSISGGGGDGGKVQGSAQSGSQGGDGIPLPSPNPGMFGLGGAGEAGSQCQPGNDGEAGVAATDGDGAHGISSLGKVALDGFHGVSGSPGQDGQPGQGGGGGGGAKGKVAPDTRGASGGSGGAGGCGGKGATGGGAGGSSIALVLLSETVPTLTTVTLKVGKGGDGGNGVLGEFGGIGGNGGSGAAGLNGTLAACNGGRGGQGSNGGSGGGGRGGHAIGIAYVIGAPAEGFTITRKVGGAAGTTPGTGVSADAGVSADTQQLPRN